MNSILCKENIYFYIYFDDIILFVMDKLWKI